MPYFLRHIQAEVQCPSGLPSPLPIVANSGRRIKYLLLIQVEVQGQYVGLPRGGLLSPLLLRLGIGAGL